MSYGIPAAALQAITAGASINGLGDSITAQAIFQPTMAPPATFPAWAANTAYTVGQCAANGGYAFYCSTPGTSAASGGPTPSTATITDGTAAWTWLSAYSNKDSFLGWAEAFSLGALHFDQTQGYAGPPNTVKRILVVNGGSGYTNPILTLNQGASATATVSGGVITAVTITNPGHGSLSFTATVTDSTGSGAVLSLVQDGSGTFGSYGCTTADMVARLPDCLASTISIFVVLGGRNDIANGTGFAAITANLRTIYETLINAGRCVVAVPVLPSTAFGPAGSALAARVNRWIRAYARQLSWANPLACTRIAVADCSKFMTDGTVLTSAWPVGGAGGTAASVTLDGTHPNTRGRMYIGAAVWQAAQKFTGPLSPGSARSYSAYDGYDPVLNPGGNVLEALAWTASTAFTAGQLRTNGSNVYRCAASGTSGSAGPSGTGGSVADGTATWAYLRPAGMSIFAGGTAGTLTAATGIAYSGSLASGWTLLRGGSAAGTVTATVETPWSDGTAGQRQSLAFSVNSGTASETWLLRGLYGTYGLYGVLPAELGSTQLYAEAEVEISGAVNLSSLYLMLYDNTVGWYGYAGSTSTGTGWRIPAATDVAPVPNNGRVLLRTTRCVLPANLVNLDLQLGIGFDASGTTAGSAAATVKVNYMGVFRALTA